MLIKRGSTLHIRSGPRHDPERRHLHVVVIDADEAGNVVVVPVCSFDPDCDHHDATCVLEAHEHNYLTRPSFLLYQKARVSTVESIEAQIAQGNIARDADMNGQALLKVRNGVKNSPNTPRKIKKMMD